jgi:hypothetical protein
MRELVLVRTRMSAPVSGHERENVLLCERSSEWSRTSKCAPLKERANFLRITSHHHPTDVEMRPFINSDRRICPVQICAL